MGVINYEFDVISSVPPAKLFKAFVLDGDNLIPKIVPQAIKSVEILQGDGGVGTIKLVTYAEGNEIKSVKHRVDGLDKDSFTYSYTITEGDVLKDVLESISVTIKVEPSADGGSVCKNINAFHTKGDAKITEEEIKDAREKGEGLFKVIEAHLLANPDY